MDLVAALDSAFDHTATVVAGVRPDQMDGPTPCTEWDVRALMAHTLGVVTNIGRGVEGQELLGDVNGLTLDGDAAAQFRTAAARTLAAWKQADLAAEVNIGAGPMPGMAAASINLLDTATHSWDLARATGQPEELPGDLATQVLGASRQIVTPEIRQYAGFGDAVEVDADATPTQQLVAFLGRRP